MKLCSGRTAEPGCGFRGRDERWEQAHEAPQRSEAQTALIGGFDAGTNAAHAALLGLRHPLLQKLAIEMARILPTVTHRKRNGVDLTEIVPLRIAKRLRYAAGG